MNDPCFHCVSPKRHPGCHDTCEDRKAYFESDDYAKLQSYKNTYFKSHLCKNSVEIHKAMRRKKSKGASMLGYKGIG